MYFLNDKFFRVTVILFFLLMALPFMFSSPQEMPEKTDATSALEFEDKNPVYKVIDRIARFYGFKNDKSKDFDLRNKRVELLSKQQQTENKEIKQNDSKEIKEQTIDGKKIIEEKNSASAKNTTEQIAQETKNVPNYVSLKGNTYQVLTDQNNQPYIMTKKGPVLLDSLPKTQFSKRPNNHIYSPKTAQNQQQEIKSEAFSLNNSAKATQNTFNQNPVAQKSFVSAIRNKTASSKGHFGQDYFSYQSKKSNDLYTDFNASAKEIMDLKLNQKEKEQDKDNNRTYTKNYKAEVLNPATGKREITTVQKQFTEENFQKAEEIKQMTLANIKTYNDQVFKYEDEARNQKEFPFPTKDEINILQNNSNLPPHMFIYPISNNELLLNQYNLSQKKAKDSLPVKKNDYPILQFIYKKEGNEILRAPRNSFHVVAVSRALADKVSIPIETGQTRIDFGDIKESIYVVPEEDLYTKYKSLDIPVIYYPDLSPANLGEVYKTAPLAIETLNKNKQKLAEAEQLKKKEEIELILQK